MQTSVTRHIFVNNAQFYLFSLFANMEIADYLTDNNSKVSAYVANLAAFLTQSLPDFVGTMDVAVEKGMAICAHPVLQSPLEIAWPRGNFVFSQSGREFYGLLDDYDAGNCDVMAVGRIDTTGDSELMNMFCQRGLVYTDSLVIENVSLNVC